MSCVQVAGGDRGKKQVSYPYFTAFIGVLNNMELVKQIFNSATKGNVTAEITKGISWVLIIKHLRRQPHGPHTNF
jgi:hypothetical protein